MSDHAETALDMLRCADDLADRPDDVLRVFLAAAQVHALLSVADAVRAGAVLALPYQTTRPTT